MVVLVFIRLLLRILTIAEKERSVLPGIAEKRKQKKIVTREGKPLKRNHMQITYDTQTFLYRVSTQLLDMMVCVFSHWTLIKRLLNLVGLLATSVVEVSRRSKQTEYYYDNNAVINRIRINY